MNTLSNKENLVNRTPTVLSHKSEKSLPLSQQQQQQHQQQKSSSLSSNVSSSSTPIGKIVGDQKIRIKELEDLLNQNHENFTILQDQLAQYKSSTSVKLNNNRIRNIQQLKLENANLLQEIESLKYQQSQSDKLTVKLNNQRIRTIHKLKNENLSQKSEIERLNHQIQQLLQNQQGQYHALPQPVQPVQPVQQQQQQQQQQQHVVQQTFDDQTLNYHQMQVNRNLTFTNDYGIMDNDEHVGEC